MTKMHNIPDWEEKYSKEDVITMPWYYQDIDPDYEIVLDRLNVKSGVVLDIGTGPGTQAIALAKRGFEVVGTDVSLSAIKKASSSTDNGLNISFIQDDILDTKLTRQFDLVFDRGCFHIFQPEKMVDYARVLHSLIKPQGYAILKCYSHLESNVIGPYCYRPEDIDHCFSSLFKILSIKDTVYYGTVNPLPKALISVLIKE